MLSFLFTSLHVHFLTIYIFSFQNRAVPFPGRRSWEATKPGFSFFGYYFVVVYSIMDAVCFCCLFQFFSTKPRDCLGRTSLIWPTLCLVGHKTLTQSICVILCCVPWLCRLFKCSVICCEFAPNDCCLVVYV